MTDPIRHPALTEAIESAIGLNVDCGGTQGVHRVRDAVLDAIQPELDALAALRQVARGYCPECGRGDAGPTTDDWEQQRQRADHLAATLREVLDHFVYKGHPGEACLSSGWVRVQTVEQWRNALDQTNATKEN